MVEKKEDLSYVSYLLGILSIVFGVFNPVPGIIFGIIGIVIGKKQRTPLARKGVKFSTIGIIVGMIVLIATLIIMSLAIPTDFGAFPIG